LAAALVGGLAWKFWPTITSTPSSLPRPSAPAPIPSTVQAPNQPTAPPASSSSTSAPPDRAAISAAGGSIEPVSVTYQDKHVKMDFGSVALTLGVPAHLTMPTGQTGTVTAALAADGRLQMDVDIQGTAPGGQATMLHGVFFGDAKSGGQIDFGNDDISILMTVKLAGP
jgi:hypothetical protein